MFNYVRAVGWRCAFCTYVCYLAGGDGLGKTYFFFFRQKSISTSFRVHAATESVSKNTTDVSGITPWLKGKTEGRGIVFSNKRMDSLALPDQN